MTALDWLRRLLQRDVNGADVEDVIRADVELDSPVWLTPDGVSCADWHTLTVDGEDVAHIIADMEVAERIADLVAQHGMEG